MQSQNKVQDKYRQNSDIMKATIKFIDANLVHGKTDLMIGLNRVTIASKYWDSLRKAICRCGVVTSLYPLRAGINLSIADTYNRKYEKEVEVILKLAII